jgi:hypothetical protein
MNGVNRTRSLLESLGVRQAQGRERGLLLALLLPLIFGLAPEHAGAQVVDRPANGGVQLLAGEVTASERPLAPVPFGPGELLRYKVKVGIFGAGEGEMAITTIDTVRGRPSYHAVMSVRGGLPFARVESTFQTWMDVETLQSHRFVKDQNELGTERHRYYEMYPDSALWRNLVNDRSGPLASGLPQDDISFVHFVRSLPLEVGDVYTFPNYFKEDGNPVVIEVLRIENREVPAGTFETIVVRPTIQTDGLFSEGGEAEIHLSNDDRRLVVYLRSSIPVMGSLTLHLTEIQEGTPLNKGFQSLRPDDVDPSS